MDPFDRAKNMMVSRYTTDGVTTPGCSNLTKVDTYRKFSCDSSNTVFYDESPKMKRFYRLRRSIVRALSTHSDMSEEDVQ